MSQSKNVNAPATHTIPNTAVETIAPSFPAQTDTIAKPTALSKKSAAISASIDGTVLTLAFSNGKSLMVDIATLKPEILTQAALHGIKQKTVDGAAIARNPDTGRSATIDEKFEAVKVIVDRITRSDNPQWNIGRSETATGKKADDRLLALALVDVTKKSFETVAEFVAKLTPAQKTAISIKPAIAAAITALRLANVDKSIDTDSLLDELNDLS